jgi:Carboxypeptidase regulatory-like domain/TonB dependent receptor
MWEQHSMLRTLLFRCKSANGELGLTIPALGLSSFPGIKPTAPGGQPRRTFQEKQMVPKFQRLIVLAASIVLSAVPAVAQSSSATLSGIVSDTQGAVVPNTSVLATQLTTGEARSTKTDMSGGYSIPNLDIGQYSVTASAPGFKKLVIPSITLQVNQLADLNLTLEVGAVSEEVRVTTSLPLLNSQSSTVGQVIENRSIESLALNGRQFWQLTSLVPGAAYTPGGQQISRGGSGIRSSSVNVTINGASSTFTGWLLDGVSITDLEAGGTNLQPNVDALEEFKVESANMSAEYGHTPNVVSATTKSGTNSFHGVAFEFLRNDYFNAHNYFATTSKDGLKRNQFGGALGGPIKRDRVFFFTDYEQLMQSAANVFNDILPTNAMRTGNFSANSKKITDPTTGKPFPGNIIPSNRISSQALFFLNYMPTQSQGVFTATQGLDTYKGDIRGDAVLTNADHVMGRYSILDNEESDPNPYPALGVQALRARAQNVALNEAHIFNSRWLNELRAGYYRDFLYFASVDGGTNYIQKAGITGYDQSQITPSFPYITLSGYTAFQGSGINNLPKTIYIRTWQYSDSVSYNTGKHDLEFGAQLVHQKDAFIIGQSQEGTFGFTTKYTGDAFGDYLLGLPATALRSYPLSNYGQYANLWALFVQDNYRVLPNLTLNLGLRWEYNPFFTATNGQMAAFDSSTGKLIVPMKNGQLIVPAAQAVVPVAYPLYSDRILGTDALHLPQSIRRTGPGQLAPRIGLAFRPTNTDRLVVRAAYGIFPMFLDANMMINWTKAPPFLISQTTNNGTSPTYNWSNPFLGQSIVAPNNGLTCPGTTLVLATCVTPSLYTAPPTLQHTYMQQYNLVVQTELAKNVSLEASYVGNHTTHLQVNGALGNLPPPAAGTIQTRRPYAQWGQFNLTLTNGAGNYNALQAKLEKRFSSGVQALVSYTYSKCMDNAYTGVDPAYTNPYAVCDFDLRHNITISSLYQLPFGKGQKFLGNASWPVNALLGGWEIAAIATLRSGLPFTPVTSSDLANTGATTELPNRTGSGHLAHRTTAAWFNVSDFSLPAQFKYGNSERNILRSDGIIDIDTTIKKNFVFTEQRYVEFRVEAFNTANHPTFAAPNATIGSTSAGTITSTLNANRILEAALKLYF